MDPKLVKLLPGVLFDLAGIGFIAAAVLGRQTSFYAIGGAFLAIGFVFLINAVIGMRQAGPGDPKAP